MYTERVQVLLSRAQRERLEALARRRDASMGAVVREAIEAYIAPSDRTPHEALAELFALSAPVDDWEAMKAEIVAGATR